MTEVTRWHLIRKTLEAVDKKSRAQNIWTTLLLSGHYIDPLYRLIIDTMEEHLNSGEVTMSKKTWAAYVGRIGLELANNDEGQYLRSIYTGHHLKIEAKMNKKEREHLVRIQWRRHMWRRWTQGNRMDTPDETSFEELDNQIKWAIKQCHKG